MTYRGGYVSLVLITGGLGWYGGIGFISLPSSSPPKVGKRVIVRVVFRFIGL